MMTPMTHFTYKGKFAYRDSLKDNMWIWIVKPFHYGLQTFFSAVPIVMDLITKVHNQSPVLRCVFCVRDFFCEKILFVDKYGLKRVKYLVLPTKGSKGFGVEKIPILAVFVSTL